MRAYKAAGLDVRVLSGLEISDIGPRYQASISGLMNCMNLCIVINVIIRFSNYRADIGRCVRIE
jgi:hypothetical protein